MLFFIVSFVKKYPFDHCRLPDTWACCTRRCSGRSRPWGRACSVTQWSSLKTLLFVTAQLEGQKSCPVGVLGDGVLDDLLDSGDEELGVVG